MGLAVEAGMGVPCLYKFGGAQNCVMRVAKFDAAVALTLARHESRLSGWGGCGLFEAAGVTDGTDVVPIVGVAADATDGAGGKT